MIAAGLFFIKGVFPNCAMASKQLSLTRTGPHAVFRCRSTALRHSDCTRRRTRANCVSRFSDNTQDSSWSRRSLLSAGVLLSLAGQASADPQIEVVTDEPGFGQHAVQQGDLVLIHYTGSLEGGGVFDTTKGGLKYRDGGSGVFRPVVIRLSGYPQPGICQGLQQAVQGMTIGGKRTVKVPADLGFGKDTVLAPYAIVPGGSALQYDVELLRVSSVGPDLLVKGISRCGAGGASATAENCSNIQPAEFF